MKIIHTLAAAHRQRCRDHIELDLRHQFEVVERSGSLWLTHSGVAFRRIPDYASASEIAALLNEARQTSINFIDQ